MKKRLNIVQTKKKNNNKNKNNNQTLTKRLGVLHNIR